MPSEVTAPKLSYEQINQAADDFLREYGQAGIIPVDIEAIAEFNLHLNIFPFPHLQKEFDLDGFLAGDITTIYIDEFVYYKRPTRYRYSIAHEIGHFVFHKDLMTAIRPHSVAEWKNFVLGVDDETYGWLEYQAYVFGGAVLMPRSELKNRFDAEIKLLKPKIDYVLSEGLSIEESQEYIINAVASRLVPPFDVSIDVATRRISDEIKRGHLSLT